MATKPGILTDWPWKPLGNFEYLILASWAFRSIYAFLTKDEPADLAAFLTLPFLLSRMLHSLLWIPLSRYRTAKGGNRIVDWGIDFEQVDRERGWDDQILFNGILFYKLIPVLPRASKLPPWRTDGALMLVILQEDPVEFIFYWMHRALHHHYLYTCYHSHHHSSIVTEPITSAIHPFADHIGYYLLFAFPMATLIFMGMASIGTFIDHCNFELVPKRAFSVFPPLKYLMHRPSYHSLHHTQFQTNNSLFMPFYDYIYGTVDKSADRVGLTYQERALRLPRRHPPLQAIRPRPPQRHGNHRLRQDPHMPPQCRRLHRLTRLPEPTLVSCSSTPIIFSTRSSSSRQRRSVATHLP